MKNKFVLHLVVSNSVPHRSSWEADSRLSKQDIPRQVSILFIVLN